MLKKFFIPLTALLFSVSVFAVEIKDQQKIEEGKQYVDLLKFESPDKEVLELFSFNCISCYRIETEFKIPEYIEKKLPKNVLFKKYSLNNFGPLAQELSEAWAIANVLEVQKEFAKKVYNAIHKTKTLKTVDDIKKIFNDVGVDNEKYESMKTHFLVNAFMIQQSEAQQKLQPSSIPSFYVNGKYMINPQGLNQATSDGFVKDFSRVINHLLKTK